MVVMANTPLRVHSAQQNALDVFISPQSTSRKHLHKRTSIGASGTPVLAHTPTNILPDAAEDELDVARQRRHSRNFSGIPLTDKNDAAEPLPSAKWSKDELLQHYSQCIKLSQENKINHKNAFDLQLIEHMAEMIRQDGALNFRVAGGTIFAGAKIYASRVDAIHSQIYRVLGSLSGGDKDDNQDVDDNNPDDPEKKTRKRKKNSKIVETNEGNLRLHTINCFTTDQAKERSQNTAIDAASYGSVTLNCALHNTNDTTLQYNSESPMTAIDGANTADTSEFPFKNSNCINLASSRPTTSDICSPFDDFNFDATNMDLDFLTCDSDNEKTETPSNEPIDETMNNCIEPCFDEDNIEPDDGGVFDSQPEQTEPKPKDVQNVHDVTELVAIAPVAEYSYFMPNALALCDGPTHWRKLRSHRVAITSAKDKESGVEIEKPRPKKRKVEEKRNIAKRGKIERAKRLQPQKISKAKMESLRNNVQDQLLLEYEDRTAECLTRAKNLHVVLKPLSSEQLKTANVSITDNANAVNFNYADDEFCPAPTNDDYDDHDTSADLFPDTDTCFPDFTQTITQSVESRGDNADYNALVEGDHLLDHPRKAEKIQIHFAKRAKRIDVRRLKSAMWTLIKDDDVTTKDTEKDEQPKEVEVETEEASSSTSEPKNSQLFSNMYSQLPDKVSKNMWENLSIPLAFTCLLHLANEKQLKIEGLSSLGDIKISQEPASEKSD